VSITDTTNLEGILSMERQYRVRYEQAPWGLFPVTHRIEGDPHATWGHISISNFENVQWCLYDARGSRIIHGAELNHARTRQGYWRALRTALRHMRGGHRVYPREADVRKWPAGQNPWIWNMVRDADRARAQREGRVK